MAKSLDHNHRVLPPQSDACLTTDQVQALLEDSLSPTESAVVEEHLSNCEHCRTQLETEFGAPPWWPAAKESLSESSSNEPGSHESDSNHADWRQLLGPTDDPSMLGRIGNYEVIGMTGRGGMGVVFKALDGALNRYVAIKMLAPHLATSGAARKRFAREAQAAAAVVDDNVLPIYGVDQWQGIPYFVMQYSRGMTLQKRIQDQGPLELKEILRIGMQTAKGLAAAHAQGLVHRDVKPSNILLDGSVERILLSDFGLARAVDDASLTRTGTITGTPQYMSPEQVQGGAVDARSDLFSLGCVLYALCAGRPPFRAESSYAILRKITDEEPRPIRQLNPEIPEWFQAVVAKLMAKSPSDRLDSAAAVAVLLEQCLAHVQQPLHSPLPVQVKSLVIGGTQTKRLSRFALIGLAIATVVLIATVSFSWIFSAAAPSVEGKWHDEAWGEVTLTPSTPGEYDGVFTGLDGKAKGIIRLRWSRKEGRFNGTWSDGESQTGRISLRPTEGEIRGALTTVHDEGSSHADPQDKAWHITPPKSAPGKEPFVERGPNNNWFATKRPRLGDFVWTRQAPAAQAASSSHHEHGQRSLAIPKGVAREVAVPPNTQMTLAYHTINWRPLYIGRAMEPQLATWHQITPEQRERMLEICRKFLRDATPATRDAEEKRAQSAVQDILTVEQDQLLRKEIWLAINATLLRGSAAQDQLGLERHQRRQIDEIWRNFEAEVQRNNGWLTDGTDSHQQVFDDIMAVLTAKQRELFFTTLQDSVFDSGHLPGAVSYQPQTNDEDTPLTHEDLPAEEARVREASRKLRDPNAVLLGELQGTWTMTAMVLPDGNLGTVTKPAEAGVMIRFDDKSGYITQGTGDEGSKFTYIVDASTTPAEIDLKHPNGTFTLGLITIKDGTLELQLGAGGDARPSSDVKPSIHQLYRRTKVYWQWIPSRE